MSATILQRFRSSNADALVRRSQRALRLGLTLEDLGAVAEDVVHDEDGLAGVGGSGAVRLEAGESAVGALGRVLGLNGGKVAARWAVSSVAASVDSPLDPAMVKVGLVDAKNLEGQGQLES